jgi:aspartate racemase
VLSLVLPRGRTPHRLTDAGAQFLICPDNTVHQALPLLLGRSPLPWLHIAEAVAEAAATRGYRKLAITGTSWLMNSEVYPEKLRALHIDLLRPLKVSDAILI